MSDIQTIEKTSSTIDVEPIVNQFSITVGTVNGSGSQTSNLIILRALFKMGIPVSGKNLFPSNIQGLPTWYTIRVVNSFMIIIIYYFVVLGYYVYVM